MDHRVVVTGIGMVSPLGLDTESTWKALLAGKSGIDYISSFDAEGFECRIAGEVKGFDPTSYLSRKEARHLDRFAQLAIAAAREAVQRAELKIDDSNAERVGCLIASGIGGIITLSEQLEVLATRGPRRVSPFLVPMILINMASGQVSIMEGAKGPNICTVSACSSGADAIGEAMEIIRRGEADAVIAGGTEASICPIAVAGFSSAGTLSKRNDDPQAASRPFDAQRDGFVMAEGAAVLILERADHAIARGAPVLSEVCGYGATADAHHITQPAPGGEGAARAMRIALRKAHLQPKDISYINAHGTSTPTNDRFETMAIKDAFGEEAYKVRISSTKSMTGHLLGAAGALEASVCVLAIQRGAIPPTVNLENPDPDCDLGYTPNMALRGRVTSAMTNSLGFGGHNASLVFRAWNP